MIVISTSHKGGETTVKETIADIKEWFALMENECDLDVTENEHAFILEYIHFGFNDGDSVSVYPKVLMTKKEIKKFRKNINAVAETH